MTDLLSIAVIVLSLALIFNTSVSRQLRARIAELEAAIAEGGSRL